MADVARGTASGCDAALRPRGRARVARTERKRRALARHVAGGHMITRSTWAPVWAPRGRLASGGPTGIVGPS